MYRIKSNKDDIIKYLEDIENQFICPVCKHCSPSRKTRRDYQHNGICISCWNLLMLFWIKYMRDDYIGKYQFDFQMNLITKSISFGYWGDFREGELKVLWTPFIELPFKRISKRGLQL